LTLDQARKGAAYQIKSIPTGKVQAQAIRFGLSQGEIITCGEVIPLGPIIVNKNRQEIAVGRALAKKITVEPVAQEVKDHALSRSGRSLKST